MASLQINLNNSKKQRTGEGTPYNNSVPAKPQNAASFSRRPYDPNRKPSDSRDLKKKRIKEPLSPEQKAKRKKRIRIFSIIGILLLAIAGYLLFTKSGKNLLAPTVDKINKKVEEVIVPDFKQDEHGLTNFLIMGKDTREHSQGLQNTDTVIVGSYNDKTKEMTLISIPRDTWVKYPMETLYYRRVNGVYARGEKSKKDTGVDDLMQVAEDVTGLKIQYWGMVDLGGFKKAVDQIGGIEVDVERAFTDYMFPAEVCCGYRTVSFEKGIQTMDGQTALDYARSRKALGPEGSDYQRARRQQRVIKAFLEKVVKMENLNLEMILELKKTFEGSVEYSPISTVDIRAGLARINDFDADKITSIVLDPTVGAGKLITMADRSITGGAYAIWPTLGLDKWEDVHDFVQDVIKSPGIYREAPIIYTYNNGLGYNKTYEVTKNLEKNFEWSEITYAGNSLIEDLPNVIIFVSNEKPESLRLIKKALEEQNYIVEIVRTIEGFKPKYKEDISILYGKPQEKPETSVEPTTTD